MKSVIVPWLRSLFGLSGIWIAMCSESIGAQTQTLLSLPVEPAQGSNYSPPSDAIFVEAESMKPDGPGWKARDYNVSDFYYGYPSGLKLLQKDYNVAGTASTTVTVPRAGKYRIWVRCLDLNPLAPYQVQVTQNSKQIVQAQFDNKTDRANEPNDITYRGRAFVWWCFDADLAQGPCNLLLLPREPSCNASRIRDISTSIQRHHNAIPDIHYSIVV